jgi:hypothetical protein
MLGEIVSRAMAAHAPWNDIGVHITAPGIGGDVWQRLGWSPAPVDPGQVSGTRYLSPDEASGGALNGLVTPGGSSWR